MKSVILFFTALTMMFPLILFAQDRQIRGRVTDDAGVAIGEASVSVKGTSVTTRTDSSGNFNIAIPSATTNPQLIITHVNFGEQIVTVTGNEVSVTMQRTNKQLDEVVVIGYGTQRRANVTGAVSSFNATNLDERPVQRVDQALVGQMAGVTVKQTTGIPGKAFSVQVRGVGSISGGNEPLYVIDGFPLATNSSNTGNGTFTTGNPLDNINPNDIESIDVLKDAAAAAIYGSRASNGVVLITTKRGRTGKPKIDFNMFGGYNEAAKKLEMMNGPEWIENATEVINATYVATFPGASASDDQATRLARNGGNFNANYMPDPRWTMPGYPGLRFIDWQDVISRKGAMQNYQVSASGGTEAVKYFISGNYANTEGFIKKVGYESYSVRANVEVNASKNLKFGVYIAPTYSITQDPGVESQNSIFHQTLSLAPVQEDTMGLLPNIGKNGQYTYSSTTNSPLGKLMYNKGTTKRYRTLGTVFAEWEIMDGLTFRTSVNLDNTDNIATTYVPYITTGTLAQRTFTGSNNLLASTSGTYNSYRRQTFVNENTLNYGTIISDDHNINVLAGYSYNSERLDRATISSNTGFTNAVIETLNAAAAVTGNTNSTKNVLLSAFGRIQYSFRNKYLVSGSLRSDGSSRFGADNKYGVFSSASIGWRIIEEKFMTNIGVLSDLKLRASYGENGNNNIGDYSSIPTIASFGYVFGTTPGAVIGQAPNILASPDLRWERSKTYDVGVDFGFLKDRIVGSFDYYNKLNTDLLLNVQVPSASGFTSYLTNIGSVRNVGLELELTSRNLVGDFQWNTSVNLTYNRNKILALAPGQTQIIIPNGNNVSDQILRVGYPLNSIYVLRTIGFLTANDISNKVATYGSGQAEGDLRYEDSNGDGVITEADKQIVGHPNPDYTFGITNTVRYKGFDLNVLIQGQTGGKIFSSLGRAITRPGQGRSDNHPKSFVRRWRSPTDQGEGRFGKAYATYNSPISAATDWVYPSDYIRIRNISLGYNLKPLIKTSLVQNARIYFTLENFFGWDKYTNGLNPEAANTSQSSNAAFPAAGDYGGLPLAKSMVLGLNLTF
jgi:TonB-linked SusC/RagA family outer membrane protein